MFDIQICKFLLQPGKHVTYFSLYCILTVSLQTSTISAFAKILVDVVISIIFQRVWNLGVVSNIYANVKNAKVRQ